MERLTYYDHLCRCYKIRPEAKQGKIIQNLGKYEDVIVKINIYYCDCKRKGIPLEEMWDGLVEIVKKEADND